MEEQKGVPKIVPRKGSPKPQSALCFHAGRLLETGLASAFSRTETTVRTTTAATTATVATVVVLC